MKCVKKTSAVGILAACVSVCFLSSTALSFALAGDVPEAVQEAVDAGKSTSLPDYEALMKGDAVQGFINDNTGSTAELEALRQNGQAVLYAPGRAEADACWSRNDPKCLAVQMVDKGSTNRPTLDPDLAGDLTAGRDEVIDKADDMVDLDGTGSSVGNCTDHTTTITKPEETQTCDVRLGQTGGSSVEEICEHRFEEIVSQESVWACEVKKKESKDAKCSVPVVVRQETTTVLTCFEGKKDAELETCPVTVTAESKQKHYAACLKPAYKSVTKTCTRRLTVTAQASCKPGQTASTSNSDPGVLGEDMVPGMDTLTVTSICSTEGFNLQLRANGGAGDDVTMTVTSQVFDAVRNVPEGQIRFSGDVTCNKADCIANATLTVWWSRGSSHVLQGDVSVRFPFVRYVKTSETEHWSETCTGL